MPRVYQCFHRHTVTNSDGRWTLGPVDPDTDVGLRLRDDRYLNPELEHGVNPRGLETKTHQVTLQRGRMIEALILDALGQPLPDRRVLLRDPEFPEPLWHPQMASSNDEGLVRFYRLEDKTYILETDDFDEELLPERRELRPWYAGDQEPVQLVQRLRPIVVFEVVDRFGIPLEGAHLILQIIPDENPVEDKAARPQGHRPIEAEAIADFLWSDERGRTETRSLPEQGRLKVLIQHPEHPSEIIELDLGQPEYRLRLSDPAREVPGDLIGMVR